VTKDLRFVVFHNT